MSINNDLFLALATAERPDLVKKAIMSEMSLWKDDREPKSLLDVPSKPVGGIVNNAGPIESGSNPMAGANEIVTNALDTLNERWQLENRFPTGSNAPTTPPEAMALMCTDQKAEYGGVYMMTSGMMFDRQKGQSGKLSGSQNLLVLDGGVGIKTDNVEDTILSISGSNKLGNVLLAGRYGYGGKMALRFAEFTFFYTISMYDPDVITYTVAFRVHNPNHKSHHYVYLTDIDGEMLTARVSELPKSKLHLISKLDDAKALAVAPEGVLQKKVPVCPNGGTGVKLIGYRFPPTTFSSKLQMYNLGRTANFGNPVPVHFIQLHGSDKTRAHNNIVGLRYNLRGRPVGKVANRYRLMHHQPPHTIMNGKATLELWIVDSERDADGRPVQMKGEDKASSHAFVESAPISGLIEQGGYKQCVFITLNGQTHKRLTCGVLLRNTDLSMLDGHVIIEINIDGMNTIERSNFITSTREQLSDEGASEVREAIYRYLLDESGKGSPLRLCANEIRSFHERKKSDKPKNTNHIANLLNNLAKLTGLFGGKDGEKISTDDKREDRGIKMLNDPPTYMTLTNRFVVERGKATYFTVHTDAIDVYGDSFMLDLSEAPFLTEGDPKVFAKGRKSFQIICDPTVAIGTTCSIKVTLAMPEGYEPFVGQWDVEVIEPLKREKNDNNGDNKPNKGRKAPPQIDVFFIDQTDKDFHRIRAGVPTADIRELAFSYENMGEGKIQALANLDFGPYKKAVSGLRFSSDVNSFKERYEAAIMSMIFVTEANRDPNEAPDAERDHRVRADMATVSLSLLMLDHTPTTRLRARQVGPAQAEEDEAVEASRIDDAENAAQQEASDAVDDELAAA